jgi:uncharacterized iron-regulated membrane protein
MKASLHRVLGLLLLPLLVILSWSGTLSLYRAELDRALTPALQQTQPLDVPPAPVATAQHTAPDSKSEQARQFALALQYQQQVAPQAAAVYLEFASARKPYLTVHLRQAGSWQLQQSWLALADGQPFTALQTVQPGPSAQQVGSWFFSLHYQLLGLLGRHGQTLALAVAFAALWLSLAGVWLWWQRRRQAAGAALQWHQWLGVLSLPWIGWFFGSALFTQFGNWQPDLAQHAGLSPAQYFATLYPQPAVTAPAARPADLAASAAAVLAQARWPVGKIQLDYESQRFLLTQDVASQFGRDIAQLQQQSFNLQGTALPQAPYSSQPVWQLRNWFYALHQAAFAGPVLRVCLFFGGLITVLMLLAAAELVGRRSGYLWLLRASTTGFVLASVMLLAVRATGLSALAHGSALVCCWIVAGFLCWPTLYRRSHPGQTC